MEEKRKEELLSELGEIEKLLNRAIAKNDFGFSSAPSPGITYQAVKRTLALLRKMLEG